MYYQKASAARKRLSERTLNRPLRFDLSLSLSVSRKWADREETIAESDIITARYFQPQRSY